jgi:hypothetical protein
MDDILAEQMKLDLFFLAHCNFQMHQISQVITIQQGRNAP